MMCEWSGTSVTSSPPPVAALTGPWGRRTSYPPVTTHRARHRSSTGTRAAATRVLEAEQRVQAEGEARALAHAADGQEHPGHEARRPVVGVVADRQRLAVLAEEHLLVGDET